MDNLKDRSAQIPLKKDRALLNAEAPGLCLITQVCPQGLGVRRSHSGAAARPRRHDGQLHVRGDHHGALRDGQRAAIPSGRG